MNSRFFLLMVYSFIGWCGEMLYCSACQRRLCEKRGFLNGPLCPIYGLGQAAANADGAADREENIRPI